MREQFILIIGFGFMAVCLLLIAYQNVVIARIAAEITALSVRTH